MAISEDLKRFAEKHIPDFKVTDETTETHIDTAIGESFVLKSLYDKDVDRAKFSGIVQHETALKKLIGDSAKGKTLTEMIATILPEILQNNATRVTELEEELKSTGKTTEDYEKLKNKLAQVEADLNKANKEIIPQLTAENEELKVLPEKTLKEYQTKEKVKQIWNGANWIDTADDDKKTGVWNRKVEGKAIPVMDEDGEIYAYEPDGVTYMKDGTGKKKFTTFVDEVLKADDVKAYKENGGAAKVHPDNSKKVEPVDKAAAHKEKMHELASAQKKA